MKRHCLLVFGDLITGDLITGDLVTGDLVTGDWSLRGMHLANSSQIEVRRAFPNWMFFIYWLIYIGCRSLRETLQYFFLI